MACEICGRGSCTKAFHPIGEQDEFDQIADKVKEKFKDYLKDQIERVDSVNQDGTIYVDYDEMLNAIENYD
jgi:hypothetical protein